LRYFILRDGEQYGPYSKAEVQRYLRTGDIYPGDLGRSETMKQWLAVSQLVSTGAPPLPSAVFDSVSGIQLPLHRPSPPSPPGLHWEIVVLLAVLTFGFFGWIWSLVLARWVRKIDPQNRVNLLLLGALAAATGSVTAVFTGAGSFERVILPCLLGVAAIGLFEIAIFRLRRSILQHYANSGVSLSLHSTPTFLFTVVYFQFKFNRIHHAPSTAHWMPVHH